MKKLIVIALIVSIISGFAVFKFATNLKKDYTVKTKPVVVAVGSIPKNSQIKPEMLTIRELPVESVHKLSLVSADEAVGRIATEKIEAGEQVLKSRLSDSEKAAAGNELSLSVKPDYRALTIKTDEISGIGGYIRQGDRVDIVAIMVNEKLESKPLHSVMVAENVEVLKVGGKSTGDSGTYTSVTVLAHANDILKLNYALSEGKYRLVLRSVIDEKKISPSPYMP
ncbi:MAG: Flp pilus assembly protein CpaB [Clostridiales bacterium]|jgi:pilus assembly protein CpaB|nr:Flp pilus assembly protein CpaB [Clostridiales bacterium]